MHSQPNFQMNSLLLWRMGRRLPTSLISSLLLQMQKLEINCPLEMNPGDGLILYQDKQGIFLSSGEIRHKEVAKWLQVEVLQRTPVKGVH